MKAMLTAVRQHNEAHLVAGEQIHSVACTGLGTFYGKMEFEEAARQMALAYRNFIRPPSAINWGFARERQGEVKYGGQQGFFLQQKEEEMKRKRWLNETEAKEEEDEEEGEGEGEDDDDEMEAEEEEDEELKLQALASRM